MAVNIPTPNSERAVFIMLIISLIHSHTDKILMESIFSGVNFLPTHYKICAHHEASQFLSLPVVDNIRFNILLNNMSFCRFF